MTPTQFAAACSLALTFAVARPASAQEAAATYECDPRAGTLVIRFTPDVAEAKPAWPDSTGVVRFMRLLVLGKDQTTVEDTDSKTFTCQLKSDRFEVTLEPGVPNPNLLGRCGGAVTGIVTIRRNGATVVDEQEFEEMNCHERQRYIKSITMKDGSPKPAIVRVSYPRN